MGSPLTGTMPSALAIAPGTRPPSASGARFTQVTPSAKDAAHILGNGQRDAGLADATGTGQGQQRNGLVEQQRRARGALDVPADEPRAWDG